MKPENGAIVSDPGSSASYHFFFFFFLRGYVGALYSFH
jgi:hypothetical protein